ncbi:type II secretion system protein [Marinisporobacter balticus]|uniref:Prepilin-type N-terminal cleavage/methylation domain-containing protein n=1 Tax=Marinisporobacter balticus TaxID=2018667 RepID=A0A4R2L1U9_9FIRM|nr:type II secretion system protein [Marinisporobacter balticus]TCO79177.1 prepilin-type N-terminal cleavage/methylation domain-containing protein [Marinisporobacter balticus]
MKRSRNENGFTLVEILIAVAILQLMVMSTSTALLQLNKIHKKTTKIYEMNKIAQSYMEEIKCLNVTIDNKIYGIEELLDKEIKCLKSNYEINIKVHKEINQEIYSAVLEIRDEYDETCILTSYINGGKAPYYDAYNELTIEDEELIH